MRGNDQCPFLFIRVLWLCSPYLKNSSSTSMIFHFASSVRYNVLKPARNVITLVSSDAKRIGSKPKNSGSTYNDMTLAVLSSSIGNTPSNTSRATCLHGTSIQLVSSSSSSIRSVKLLLPSSQPKQRGFFSHNIITWQALQVEVSMEIIIMRITVRNPAARVLRPAIQRFTLDIFPKNMPNA